MNLQILRDARTVSGWARASPLDFLDGPQVPQIKKTGLSTGPLDVSSQYPRLTHQLPLLRKLQHHSVLDLYALIDIVVAQQPARRAHNAHDVTQRRRTFGKPERDSLLSDPNKRVDGLGLLLGGNFSHFRIPFQVVFREHTQPYSGNLILTMKLIRLDP